MLKNKRCWISAVILTLIFCIFSYGQNLSKKDQTKPQIYIDFESKIGKEILLRLFNNSNTAIKVCVDKYIIPASENVKKIVLSNGKSKFAFVDGKETQLCYGVETYRVEKIILSKDKNNKTLKKEKTEKSGLENCRSSYCGFYQADFGYNGWVEGGNSILFKIPTKYLKEDHRIYLKYAYEWEEESENNPTHFVYFNSASIPKQ